ncbi:outer membrane lipoprotein-sorting protein [uncultured Desulfobacter sp.]|uniref:outer membrane lipoprotein-sorting protein n=1 Tax=uncultured Desulfobacter sp. TaxID=240139 RepID=UPI002AAA7A25|nr:outer membrane lipoprotein-sorting protein [uncultured Desulfobacter sp.]
MRTTSIAGWSLFIAVFLLFDVQAAEITGSQLAQQIFDRDRGKDSLSSSQMVLINRSGKKNVRFFATKRVEENGLETQLLRFTDPADIKGTGFLSIEQPGWETEQFLYLPALKRTRRIVSSQKDQRFVNSDFTFEDMERHPVSDYTYQITGSEKFGPLDCHILESRPKEGAKSQYSLTISLVSKEALIPVQVKYFDKKNNHIKTYKVMRLEQVQGIWTEMVAMMEDFTKNHKTYMKQESIQYNTNIDKADISRENLENY